MGKYHNVKNIISWVFNASDGFCGVEGYYEKSLNIILKEMGIDIVINDELDEASEFWDKMREHRYII